MLSSYSPVVSQPITANVVGAKVGKQNKKGAEYRSGYEFDEANSEVDHGFTDRIDLFYNVVDDIQFRVFFNRFVPNEGDSKFTSVFVEPAFQIFNSKQHGFNGTILTGLTITNGEDKPNQGRMIIVGAVPYKKFEFRHNSILAHQFGTNAETGVRYETRWRITYQMIKKLRLGVEMFNNFLNMSQGQSFDQGSHRAGLMMEGKMTDEFGFQLGTLAGISEQAPDLAVKLWLNYVF